jgi:glutamyl-tRNA synthetase
LKVTNDEIDDFIILRSNERPTYHLAVVADDIDMGITTVIRGDDHISNTPKQVLIYRALGKEPPVFAHVPLILGEDKKRLSKRHGATSISEYKEKGYLPKALINYLSLLGWSPGDDRELMEIDEIVNSFSLSRVNPKSAVFDEKKLQWMNRHYINLMSTHEIVSYLIQSFDKKDNISLNKIEYEYLIKVIEILKPKVYRITDFIELGSYFFTDPVEYDEKARKKYWKDNTISDKFVALHNELGTIVDFNTENIENVIRNLAEKLEISAAKIIHPTRLAVTGSGVSPGLFETLEILGKDTVLRRINNAIEYLLK